MGKHQPATNYLCYDEARAILAALDGAYATSPIPTSQKQLTLSARQGRKHG